MHHPSSSSSSSSLAWADWVPECLQPAIAIASELPYHEEHILVDEDDAELEEEVLHSPHGGGDPDDEDDEVDPDGGGRRGALFRLAMDDYPSDVDDGVGGGSTGAHQPYRHVYHHHHHHHHRLPQEQQQVGRRGTVVCVSCKEVYAPRKAGTCRECYEEASETEQMLKKEIEELHARIAFLGAWAPEAMADNFSDLILESSDGSKIRAHKAVLVSRSSVFKAMLENEMEESRNGIIRITDFSYEVLRLFVHYLYTAEIFPESLEECAYDLLALAEKYNVKQLKLVCERFMISKLSNANALCSFEYACQHGAKAFKEAALNIILENIHELPAKDEYQDLVARDARLVVEIFEAYLGKQTKSK